MAENSWNFYKAISGDSEKGTQGTHSSLSNPLDSVIGSTYYRDFSSNSGIIKAVLTGSNFVGLDGSKAVSMRAHVRMNTESANKHIMFLAKTNTSNPYSSTSDWYKTVGYKIGISDQSFSSNTIKGAYNVHVPLGVNLLSSDLFAVGTWHLIRADFIPSYSNGSIIEDHIKLFKSTDNGNTWTQIGSTVTGNISNYPWGHSTNKYWGFQTWGCSIDNFEIYVSNESA